MKLAPFLLLSLSLLAGCAGTRPAKTADAARGPVYFRGDGAPANLGEVIAAAKASDAILVGENHGHPIGLPTAAKVWDGVLKDSPKAALALEFFERDQQAALDDYLAGITDKEAFKKAAARKDSNYPPGHEAMVEAAKAANRPVFAANVPWRYLRIASRQGYDKLNGLTAEQRRHYRIPDELPTGKYREKFEEFIRGNEGGASPHGQAKDAKPPTAEEKAKAEQEFKERVDRGFRSQSLWDWTMAESVARSLDAGNIPTLLVIGRFHIDEEGGTVLALRKQRPATRILTVSFVDAWADVLRAEDKNRADFVIYVGPSPQEQ